jgi:hypothetical protein
MESTLKSGSLTYRELSYFEFSQAETRRERQSPPLQLGPQDTPFHSANDSNPRGESSLHDIETDDGWPRGHGP